MPPVGKKRPVMLTELEVESKRLFDETNRILRLSAQPRTTLYLRPGKSPEFPILAAEAGFEHPDEEHVHTEHVVENAQLELGVSLVIDVPDQHKSAVESEHSLHSEPRAVFDEYKSSSTPTEGRQLTDLREDVDIEDMFNGVGSDRGSITSGSRFGRSSDMQGSAPRSMQDMSIEKDDLEDEKGSDKTMEEYEENSRKGTKPRSRREAKRKSRVEVEEEDEEPSRKGKKNKSREEKKRKSREEVVEEHQKPSRKE
jgi:hypothetical protein